MATRNNLTRDQARSRAAVVSEPRYDVQLDLTGDDETFRSVTTVEFQSIRPGSATFIDFIGPAVEGIELNGKTLPAAAFDGGRIELTGLEAQNVLKVSAIAKYMHDGTGLSRFQDPLDGRDYLHSSFESNDAHRMFACFDQPDIKGTFTFQVKAPAGWTVVSNMAGAQTGEGIWSFPTTKVISTYLAAVVAGHYHSVHTQHRGIPLGVYCRQSLAPYLDTDEMAEIVELTGAGLDYFESRYGIPYPFGKYDQLFVPEFSAGAMENPGCVTFNERYIFRSRVTQAARQRRAETILHEMAHMWFGDLVTMKWFDDLWLNESFATYMGSLASAEATRFKNAWTWFAAETKVAARTQDEMPTTHPIVSDIPDVESVHLNFDKITYNKGGAVLKQLAAWLGEETFFDGVHIYLERHSYANATLADFLAALEEASGRALKAWARVWLEEAGLNKLALDLEVENHKIRSAAVVQTAPESHPVLRPHHLRIGLFDVGGDPSRAFHRRRTVELDVDGARTPVPQLAGEIASDFALLNDGDLAYARLALDPGSLELLLNGRLQLDDDLARAVVWGSLWDMVRSAELRAGDYVDISIRCIDIETDPAVFQSLMFRAFAAFEEYASIARRGELREDVARAAFDRLRRMSPGSDLQLHWTNTFIDAARRPADLDWVAGLLDGRTRLDGLTVDFAVRWAAVTALATAGAAGPDVIADELERDPTDMGRRAAAAARAARPLPEAKAEAWEAVANGRVSLATKRALADGFHRPDQETLLAEYVQPYFDTLLPFWESHDIDEALMFVRWMYPVTIVTPEVVTLTDQWLARDLPGPMKRSLLESQDDTKRALRTRDFDSGQLGKA
ncbi:MAG TPA: aminopeptidase N [Candidatus Dormibacteraeota bacterium]